MRSSRSRISPAALFVNVIARISFGFDAVRADQMRDAVGENARLARAGSGDDEQRPVDVEDGLALGRVQAGEEVFVGCDGHASMLAGLPGAADRRRNRQPGFVQLSSTTMPSSSLVEPRAGRERDPAELDRARRSPPRPSCRSGAGTCRAP